MSEREDEDQPRFIDRRSSSGQPAAGDDAQKEQATQPEASLAAQLAEETEKAQAYMANWQRTAADFQNYKRRVEQEREENLRFSNAAMVINILPLMDDLERALANVDPRFNGLTWLDGIVLIYRKFQALLEMYGVTEIEAEGQSFDPNLHEAVMFGEGEDGKVTGVVQRGYKLGGRVLRPAMVVVGKTGGGAEA